MSRTLLILLFLAATFILALTLGPVIAKHSGYVLITVAGWKVEMTLVSAAVIFSGIWFVGWVLLKIFVTFATMGKLSLHWLTGLTSGNSQKHYENALLAWHRGDLNSAQKALLKLDDEQFQGMEQLLLADVARRQNNPELELQALQKAKTYKKTASVAALLLAKQKMATGEQTAGLALIEELQDNSAQTLKIQALADSGQWQSLLAALEKHKKQLQTEQYRHWKSLAATGVMEEIASKEGANNLENHWQALPRRKRKEPELQMAFVQQLLTQGLHQDAERYLVSFQGKAYEPLLLPLFRQVKLRDPVASRKKLETWLKQDENNSELLSVLGELAYHSNDLILAEKVLQKALKLRKSQTDIRLLARIKEAAQDNYAALQLYKQLV